MIWFTADEHYGHTNIISYCNRPFKDVEEMNETIIKNFNDVIQTSDTVWHIGDFTLKDIHYATDIMKQLRGVHRFIQGSHDRWAIKGDLSSMVEINVEGIRITLCHYAMRRWPRSHYGSWQLYGHSHGELPPEGRQYDVGVDNNNFYPVSFEKLKEILPTKPIVLNHLDKK